MEITMKRGFKMLDFELLMSFLAILTLAGASGVLFFRHFLYAILSLLLALVSLSGILYMIGADVLGAILFWHLGTTSIFVLLHTSFLLGPQNTHKLPRRLVPGKSFFVIVVVYTAFSLVMILPPFALLKTTPMQFNLSDFSQILKTEYAFAIFLIFSLAPFIFISCLSLLRQEKGSRNT
jgi:NADH:ubiquinone oxidoreductase subunit 6 (subunit J)